jgi:hypothetical protein
MAFEIVSITFVDDLGRVIPMEADPDKKKKFNWKKLLWDLGGLLSGGYALWISITGGGSGPPGGFRVKGQDIIIKSIRIEKVY